MSFNIIDARRMIKDAKICDYEMGPTFVSNMTISLECACKEIERLNELVNTLKDVPES